MANRTPKPVPVTSLDYRPRDYFGRLDLQSTLLTQVKGRARRAAIKDALEKGDLVDLPDHIKVAELEPAERQRIGSLHPFFMGGEYLPRQRRGEIEIARISIQSTTYDVTVIYARLVGERIHYRVVDEYDGDTLSDVTTRTSIRPLTMGQMIDFFLGAWDLIGVLENNFLDDLESMLGFFDAESEFYPYFGAALEERITRWYQAHHGDDDDDEEEEDADEVGDVEGDVDSHLLDGVHAKLTPELLSALTPEGSEEARQRVKAAILSRPDLWRFVTSTVGPVDVPELLDERLKRFSTTLTPATSFSHSMVKMMHMARLRAIAVLYSKLHGETPSSQRLKALHDALR